MIKKSKYKYFKLEKIKLNIYYFKFHVSNHQVNDLASLKVLYNFTYLINHKLFIHHYKVLLYYRLSNHYFCNSTVSTCYYGDILRLIPNVSLTVLLGWGS